MLTGKLSEEIEVKVTAAEAWKVYGSLKLGDLVVEKLPHIIQKVDVLEGNGGVGTVIKVTFPPGMPGPTYQKENFMVVDNEKRVKLVEVIEGGHLTLGFTQFRVQFEVLEKDENSCITKVTVEYEIGGEGEGEGEDASDKVSLVSSKPFVAIINVIAKILTKPKDT